MKGRQIFVDCDGVLADFDTHFLAVFGVLPGYAEEKWGPQEFWRRIENHGDFYRSLPLMPGAQLLMGTLWPLRPIILTGCPRGGWAEAQKQAWAAIHFPGVPMACTFSNMKPTFCRPGDILIDDRPSAARPWRGRGGEFILHRGDIEPTLLLLADLGVTKLEPT